MIIDKLENACFYYGLSPKIQGALEYLRSNSLLEYANGRYEIDGDNVFILVQDYNTKDNGRWEAHRDYIDIQYIIKGAEKMGFADVDSLKPVANYDKSKDVEFLEGQGDFLVVKEGYFAIFTPHDAHMPCMLINESEYVKKAVVKIKV